MFRFIYLCKMSGSMKLFLLLSVVITSSAWNIESELGLPSLEEKLYEYLETKIDRLYVQLQVEDSRDLNRQYLDYINNFYKQSRNISVLTVIQNLNISSFYQYNLWYVDAAISVERIINNFKDHDKNTIGFYIIILLSNPKEDHKREVTKIFEIMFKFNILNVVTLVRTTTLSAVVYNINPFQRNLCRIVSPFIVNRFKNGMFENWKLLPSRLENFMNCTLRFSPRYAPPYSIYNHIGTDREMPTGVEIEMVKAISNKLNFRVQYLLNQSKPLGEVFANGTKTGQFLKLENNKTDVLMGYYKYEPIRSKFLAESIPYLLDPLVIVRKRQFSKNNSWIYDPFHWSTWLCILGFFLLAVACLSCTNLKHFVLANEISWTRNNSWLDVVAIFLGIPRNSYNPRGRLRFAVIICCFAFLILNSAYQSQLYSAFNRVKSHTPPTLDDLIKWHYNFLYENPVGRNRMIDDFNIPNNKLVKIDASEPQTKLYLIANSSVKFASMTTYSSIMYLIQSEQMFDTFDILPKTLILQQICAYFQTNSYLVKPFNDVIKKLRSFGLIQKWQNDIEILSFYRKRLKRKYKLAKYPEAFNMEKFKICLFILLIGEMIATLIFIVEIFLQKLRFNN